MTVWSVKHADAISFDHTSQELPRVILCTGIVGSERVCQQICASPQHPDANGVLRAFHCRHQRFCSARYSPKQTSSVCAAKNLLTFCFEDWGLAPISAQLVDLIHGRVPVSELTKFRAAIRQTVRSRVLSGTEFGAGSMCPKESQ